MKFWHTIELGENDVIDDKALQLTDEHIKELLDFIYGCVSINIPTQLRLTNQPPPRRSGFTRASDLVDIEGGD